MSDNSNVSMEDLYKELKDMQEKLKDMQIIQKKSEMQVNKSPLFSGVMLGVAFVVLGIGTWIASLDTTGQIINIACAIVLGFGVMLFCIQKLSNLEKEQDKEES